jgi:hypothetical protein
MGSFKKQLSIQLAIAGGVLIILTIGLSFFSGTIRSAIDNLSALRADIAARALSLESLARLQTQYNRKAKTYSENLTKAVPKKEELIGLSKDFQTLANQTKVEQSFGFIGETPASGEGLGFLSFQVSASGDLTNLSKFLASVENFRFLTKVESLSISPSEPDSQKLSIRGRIFFRGE